MKSLKINDILHEKLKNYADENGVVLQNKVENKLEEIFKDNHDDNNLLYLKNVIYDNDHFHLVFDENNIKKLIDFLKRTTVNGSVYNYNELQNLTDIISSLETHLMNYKKATSEYLNKVFNDKMRY